MSCCMKLAIAFIFASLVEDDAVRAVTFCFMSGEGSSLPASNPLYQVPISSQLLNPLAEIPPGGKRETIITPATPGRGGIRSSSRMALISFIVHCHEL